MDLAAHRGRVIVVKFFAQWCKPCQKTLPAAESLHRRHDDVTFVGVSLDEYASHAAAQVRAHGITFPVIHDAANEIAGMYRVTEMPATYVIGKDGRVLWIGGAGQSEDDLARVLRSAR